MVKNSNGDTWIGEVTGDLRVNAANGDIAVDRAGAGVAAKTANGDVRLGEVARGSASLKTGFGEIEVGIRDGTAAWLDVNTQFGQVHNELDASDGPGPGRRDRRGARPHLLRRHRDPPLLNQDRRRMTTMTATRTAIAVTGLRKSFGDKVVLDGIDLNVAEGTSSRCSAPTAPARPPWCRSCPP